MQCIKERKFFFGLHAAKNAYCIRVFRVSCYELGSKFSFSKLFQINVNDWTTQLNLILENVRFNLSLYFHFAFTDKQFGLHVYVFQNLHTKRT